MYVSNLAVFFTLSTTASCFTLHTSRNNKVYPRVNLSDRGWDNGNFLDALSGGQTSIDEANMKYQQESEHRSAFREKRFQSMAHDPNFEQMMGNDENEDPGYGQGGSRFQEMMQQAKQQQGQPQPQMQQSQFDTPSQQPPQYYQDNTYTPPPPPPPPMPQQPQQPIQPQMEAPAAPMDPQAYYQALQSWQQAMVAFQQFSAANPQAAAHLTPPPPPPPPAFSYQTAAVPQTTQPPPVQPVQPPPPQQYQAPTTQPAATTTDNNVNDDDEVKSVYDYLPRRAGGNKDAYEVNNSADVYFAQLKRDSSIRTEARKRGDLETANSPFAEKGVKALGGLLSDELVAKRREQLKRNGGEFETSRDEMILPSHFQSPDEDGDKSYTGVSYKDKLMQAKKKRS